MAITSRYEAGIETMINSRLNDLHTCIPATVVSVDRSTGYISAQPSVKVSYNAGEAIPYPQLDQIPPMVISDGQKANIKMPIKTGVSVLVFFAERDPSGNLLSTAGKLATPKDQSVMGLFPVGYMIMPLVSTGYEISDTDITIENDKAKITLTPTSVKTENSSGSLELKESGDVDANGATIDTDGNITTKNGTDLDKFYAEFRRHVHGGVETGSGNTSTPSY